MTVGAWVGFVIAALILIIIGLSAGSTLGALCGMIVSAILLGFMLWYFGNTEIDEK